MRGISEPTNNRLLATLPSVDLQLLKRYLEPVLLRAGQPLHEAGSQVNQVYFPTTAIVSLLHVTSDGSSAHLAVVGSEGLVGIAAFTGGGRSFNRAVVQSAGCAYHLPAKVISREFARGGAVQQLLLRYTQALLTQMSQTAVCNRHHSLDQQLCRWLLLSLDRLPSNQMLMTQEWIATMLGVRRESVTEAAGRLQDAKVIEYRRGHITILNRAALEKSACECYSVVNIECDRLLSRPVKPKFAEVPVAKPAFGRSLFSATPSLYVDASLGHGAAAQEAT